ncbi:MAG: ATP-binding protein [Burkholderiaceae bacterium]
MSLFNASNQQLAGRPLSTGANIYRSPVVSDGAQVGTLAISLPKALSGNRDLNFLQQQYQDLMMIALAVLVLAGGVAWWLALSLTRPLMQTVSAVRKLAEGDYSGQLDSQRRDEIGSLSRDIDALSRTLHENQRSRQRWVSDISHELRTPLAIIRGELEAIRDGVRAPTKGAIDSLHDEAIRLGQLIDDLRELAIADRGALSYSMKPVNLGELVGQICEAFTARFQQASLHLIHDSSTATGPTVMGDARRLTQLLGNLLENSLRYTDAGGSVEVRVGQSTDTAIITVSDSAPGVSEAEYERLFERLYRVESSRSRASGGSGLGLSICKSIAQAHDGSINAGPASAGGLMITLTIPLAKL